MTIPTVESDSERRTVAVSVSAGVTRDELASGTAPDVFWIPGTDVADFATRGLLLDMRELADATESHSDDNFYPGPMFHLTFNPDSGNDGEMLWGLPRDVSTFALYLNLDLIAEAGAEDAEHLRPGVERLLRKNG